MMRICGSDLRWLLFLLIIVQYLNGSRSCFENERNALLSFKHTIISDPFSSLSSWGASRDDDCCKWKGIGCDNTTGHVVALHLEHEGLQGEISPSLLHLPFLNFLDLSSNEFETIPSFIGSLDKLVYLDLFFNNFSGNVPPHLGNISTLKYLDLGSYFYSPLKVVDTLEWISHLSSLEYLNMDYVDLHSVSDWLQSITKLSLLRTLSLSSCLLPSPPSSLLHINSSTLLEDLSLQDGNIATFPLLNLWLNQSYFLQYLDLSDDERMPELYFDTFEDPMEEVFFDSEWLIWKGIEREYGKNLKFMKFIDLSSNKLVGEIPIEITDLHMLNSLNLSRNKLTGSIPDKIGQMSSLESLDLSNNQLSGAIPFSMASISFLAHLDLSNNNLSGCIPLGPQLQGFTEAYQGNSKLRGPPLQTKCHRDEPGNAPQQGKIDEIEDDEYWIIWDFDFFVSMALGFILGFWGVCGTLILKRSWRHAYFQFLEDKKENIFTAILVYGAKLKRGMGAS
ncbi:receptor-like protein EIX1 isoform X3 [Ipomoea triloba]|uniref:receptor-like protein EIX1 isoform X3 n=1 Tax=Ipomoea triloba TaxID=35885 RepID=UPI00125E935E|nr:receptor-like protein EIX1 isoform X3 [Ipomoea triloba]